MSTASTREKDTKSGSSIIPSLSFPFLKINRSGKREHYTKLTATAFKAYHYLSSGDQDTDTAYTPHWYGIRHLLDSLRKLQYTEHYYCCCTTSSFIHELQRKISTWNVYKFSVQKLLPSRDSLKLCTTFKKKKVVVLFFFFPGMHALHLMSTPLRLFLLKQSVLLLLGAHTPHDTCNRNKTDLQVLKEVYSIFWGFFSLFQIARLQLLI